MSARNGDFGVGGMGEGGQNVQRKTPKCLLIIKIIIINYVRGWILVVIIQQYIHIKNHDVHFKLMKCFMSIMSY